METFKIKLARPLPDIFPVSSPFGVKRRLTIGGIETDRIHNGIDLACPIGTPVRAMVDGTVERAGWEDPFNHGAGYGLRVMQRFSYNGTLYFCWYAHLNLVLVKIGDKLAKGQVIGLSGNTGRSTGPHLHVGVRKGNTGTFHDIEFTESPPKGEIVDPPAVA